jgi:hypothetical protein
MMLATHDTGPVRSKLLRPVDEPHVASIDEPQVTSVDTVVRRLNQLCKMTTFEFAMAVGRLIVDSFYRSDLNAWRTRGPKCASFRKLARHPDLPMSPSGLYRSVALYELAKRLRVDSWKHISTSHMRLVLPLPGEDQTELLNMAENNLWSVERLRQEVCGRDHRRAGGRGGRPRRPVVEASLQTLEKQLEHVRRSTVSGLEAISPEAAQSLCEMLRRVRGSCEQLEQLVEHHKQLAQGHS